MEMNYDHWYEEDGEDNSPDSVLLSLVQSYDWAGALARIDSHPEECRFKGVQGRKPLHVACEHDAPAVVIQALVKAFPDASTRVGTSNMNPLHITCSSQHASIDVIRVLLEGGLPYQTQMRDVDGDTPLHAACRCGAPIEVIQILLEANPQAVLERDYEGLTPLLRLWVRYFVILGDDVIQGVRGPGDLTGELGEAWNKTELLLRYAYHGGPTEGQPRELPQYPLSDHSNSSSHSSLGASPQDNGAVNGIAKGIAAAAVSNLPSSHFQVVHAVAAVDCPRPVVKIATIIYPSQLRERDENGLTPLLIAAKAPIFKVRDLSDDGYLLEDQIHGDGNCNNEAQNEEDDNSGQPSVMEILLTALPESATLMDPEGRLPLHLALEQGKRWHQGIDQLITCYSEALSFVDPKTGMIPFQIAADGSNSDLTTLFEIIRTSPSLVRLSAAAVARNC